MSPQREPVKFCRHCGRIVPIDAVDCPYCDKNTLKPVGRKECPFCGEPIREKAVKCRHCGEFLDGREQQSAQGPTLYVDKAIIAGPRGGEELDVVIPDETTEGGTPAGELTGSTPKALPPGERAAPPARRGPRAVQPAVPARKPAPQPAQEKPAKRTKQRPVRYDCPVCGGAVFEGDSFCENCGHDLAGPREGPSWPPIGRPYEPAQYVLMVGAGAPVGLLVGPVAALVIAAGALLAAGWSVWRILRSEGRLRGLGFAVGGLVASLLWIVMVAALV
ncbi:MAG: hypothetical protein R6V05_06535 [Candidatus Brocadiia bacterium]